MTSPKYSITFFIAIAVLGAAVGLGVEQVWNRYMVVGAWGLAAVWGLALVLAFAAAFFPIVRCMSSKSSGPPPASKSEVRLALLGPLLVGLVLLLLLGLAFRHQVRSVNPNRSAPLPQSQ